MTRDAGTPGSIGSGETLIPSASACRFELDGGLLLLEKSSNTLFLFNNVAGLLWDLIEAGRSGEDLVASFAETWGISRSAARADIQAIVSQWRSFGLLGSNDGAAAAPAPTSEPLPDTSGLASSCRAAEWIVAVPGMAIAVAIEDGQFPSIRRLFAHLEAPAATPQVRMEIRNTPGGEYALIEDGCERVRLHDPAEAIGALYVAVLERIHPGLRWFALIHGAALAYQGRGLALVGPSGSGKSTLTAGLIGAGFDYLADDLVALAEPDGAIVPWPLPLSIKQGSFDVISRHYPQLAQALSYRTKGVDARLLIPATHAWDAGPMILGSLIFPQYRQDAAPELRPLSKFEVIERLLKDRVWLGNPITEQRMKTFLAWLDGVRLYALSYGKLEDGMRLVREIVA
jgi:Coenzyme PQQ synthesis protein D (PqqD)